MMVHCDEPPISSSSVVLVATDQLLKGGLVSNLIATVRVLTMQMVQVGETLKAAERKAGMNATAASVLAAPAASNFGGFGGGGGLFDTTPVPAATATTAS